MAEKKLLLGDEAIALGAIHAGISGVYAYPGTPSTEITEFIQNNPLAKERKLHSTWCTNEKTAMEAALGMSYAGKRALVCMKHVGMNVAADAFVNSAITGVNGGLVVLAADDPSMHSSQNEQDSRFYGKFAMIPMLEPSSQQEAYDMMDYAYTLSEKLKLPVLMRVVTRLAHSRAGVEVADIREENQLNPDHERAHWVLLPGNARKQYLDLVKKQEKLEEVSSKSPYNYLEGLNPEYDYEFGVIACGIGYNYVKEADTDSCHIPVLKVSQYPLPAEEIRTMADRCGYVLVVEDGQPFVEEQVKAILSSDYEVKGRLTETLPRTGELTPDNVGEAIGWGIKRPFGKPQVVMPRPPALCQGCGHRDVYDALNKVAAEYPDARIFGDTFVERGIGDVLIAWENEALLAANELGKDKFEIVTPSESILAEPTVSVVDKVVEKKGTKEVAEAYLKYLYSPEGQEIAAKNYYRPRDAEVAKKYENAFPKLKLFTIDEEFGGWTKAQKEHFANGGTFDQISKR